MFSRKDGDKGAGPGKPLTPDPHLPVGLGANSTRSAFYTGLWPGSIETAEGNSEQTAVGQSWCYYEALLALRPHMGAVLVDSLKHEGDCTYPLQSPKQGRLLASHRKPWDLSPGPHTQVWRGIA